AERLLERSADRDLTYAWLVHRSQNRDEHRPWLRGRADRTEPRGAVTRDEGGVRESFHASHERRPSAEPSFRDPGRCPGGGRNAVLDPVHDGASFAGDELVRGRHDPDQFVAGEASAVV